MIFRFMLLLVSVSFGMPTALAQTKAAVGNDAIVVTAQERKELQQRIKTFVRAATVVPEYGQYARRNSGYCPIIIGLEEKYVPQVLEKILAAGRAAGLRDPKPRCKANLGIVFSNHADPLMAILAARSQRLFDDSYREKSELFNSGRPIRWWYASDISAADGGGIGNILTSGIPGEGGMSSSVPGFGGTTQNTYKTSLIETSITVDLVGTFVVIDVTKARGVELNAVAAFAAMVSFAQISGKHDFAGFPSVLSLFAPGTDPSNAPTDLTDWDRAYLHALYATPPNREARLQRSLLASKMMQRIKP